MKAIEVKYCGPTNTRRTRIRVKMLDFPTKFYSYQEIQHATNGANLDDSYKYAATRYAKKHVTWLKTCSLVAGTLPNGNDVFVFVEKNPTKRRNLQSLEMNNSG